MLKHGTRSVDVAVERHPLGRRARRGNVTSIQSRLCMPVTRTEKALTELVARSRPEPFRAFDQIPMHSGDLARQVKLVAPLLENHRVAFVGDMDGTATLLGLLAAAGGSAPASLLVLDFDARVLETVHSLAQLYGFADLLTIRLYNCFDPVPSELLGKYDWFYLNPPYGSRNRGASARLFLTRGCELVRRQGGSGCLILPDDPSRPWTRSAMFATQQFLLAHGWMIREKVDHLHRYYLDDDPSLSSSLLIVDRIALRTDFPMPFAGRQVQMDEIPNFYGRNTLPPYPRSISRDGDLIGMYPIM